MKKLLFLASYVYDTGEIELTDQQLVMVTDRDVAAYTEKQRKLNPEKSMRRPFDHNEAAYDVFETWFKEVFPESTLKHVMIKRPIQSELFPSKEREVTPNEFSGPHSCKESVPLLNPETEDLSETVAIDLNGNMKDWDFGWYDFKAKEWCMQNRDFETSFELEHAVWFSTPKPRN